MDYGKYIIKEVRGHEVAIMFDLLIDHCDMGTKEEVISAGFFVVGAKATENDPS